VSGQQFLLPFWHERPLTLVWTSQDEDELNFINKDANRTKNRSQGGERELEPTYKTSNENKLCDGYLYEAAKIDRHVTSFCELKRFVH